MPSTPARVLALRAKKFLIRPASAKKAARTRRLRGDSIISSSNRCAISPRRNRSWDFVCTISMRPVTRFSLSSQRRYPKPGFRRELPHSRVRLRSRLPWPLSSAHTVGQAFYPVHHRAVCEFPDDPQASATRSSYSRHTALTDAGFAGRHCCRNGCMCLDNQRRA